MYIRTYTQLEQQDIIIDILTSKTEGFTGTADQDRYDECEDAINDVVKTTRKLANGLKVRFVVFVPSPPKYFFN